MTRLVQGIGINDGTYPTRVGGVGVKSYSVWKSMLQRCVSKALQATYPTYVGCSVSEQFRHYKTFKEWYDLQIGSNVKDFALDKDLLIKGNKLYSAETCVLLPKAINLLFIKCNAARGQLPIGVSKHGNRFHAQIAKEGKRFNLGLYDTPELAFAAYKAAKEAHIKEMADKYKDVIDPRAYAAMYLYNVEIAD